MFLRWLAVVGYGLVFCVGGWAANPPPHTYFVAQTPQAGSMLVELHEYLPQRQGKRLITRANVGPDPLTRTALIGAGGLHPTLVGVDAQNALYLITTSQGASSTQRLPFRAVTLAEGTSTQALVVGDGNEVFFLDALGATTLVAPKNWLDPSLGWIVRVQMIEPFRFAILTDSWLVLADIARQGSAFQASVTRTINLAQAGVSATFDLVATHNSAWVLVAVANSSRYGHSSRTAQLWDYNQFIRPIATVGLGNPAKVQLLDMDPVTGNLMMHQDGDYVRADVGGVVTLELGGAFDPANLIDHPLQALSWLSRPLAAAHAPAAQQAAPPPRMMGGPHGMGWGAWRVPQPPLPVPVPASEPEATRAPVAKKTVLDPVSEEEFSELFDRDLQALKGLGSPPTADQFAAAVNQSVSLKYYFQALAADQLKGLGLARQGYWLRALPGAGGTRVHRSDVVRELAVGRKRELAAGCAAILSKP